jgi:hypothetical protein
VQHGVAALSSQQFLVSAALADLAVLDDQDLVGGADGGQPVRDDKRRPAGQGGAEGTLVTASSSARPAMASDRLATTAVVT